MRRMHGHAQMPAQPMERLLMSSQACQEGSGHFYQPLENARVLLPSTGHPPGKNWSFLASGARSFGQRISS